MGDKATRNWVEDQLYALLGEPPLPAAAAAACRLPPATLGQLSASLCSCVAC